MMEAMANSSESHHVRVQGKKPLCVPAGTLIHVPVTCPNIPVHDAVELLVEPLEPNEGCLPEGLLVSPSLVKGERGGAYVPVTNVGKTDVG